MITNRGKRGILIIFAFIGSYLISYMLDPYSEYWSGYFSKPIRGLLVEWFITLVFCAVISELSIYIDSVLNTKMPWTIQPIKRLVFQSIVQILAVLLVTFILHTITSSIYGFEDPTLEEFKGLLQWTIATILVALMISAFNTGNFLIVNWRNTAMEAAEHKLQAAEHKVRAAEHKQAAAEAELQALRLQLDNHFVFNNLSVLSELILVDQQQAYQYAENFTKVYRYLLINSKKNLITLQEELKFIDAYLFLVKKRIGDGVRFDIAIESKKLSAQVPPLSVQLLIENVLKHNQTIKKNPLIVKVYSNNDNELVVENTLIPLIAKAESSGIGLGNIIGRYELISNRKPVIENDGAKFTVKIPLIV